MIKKIENCLYCGEKMESKTAKKKYCSAKCKIYYNREKKSNNTFWVKLNMDKINFIMQDIPNLKTPQAVLNYLMDNYGKSTPNLADKSKLVELPIKKENVVESPKNDIKEPTKKKYDPFNNPRFKNKFG
jgi:hypothetical protein